MNSHAFDKSTTFQKLADQRSYFKSGATRSLGTRRKALKDLQTAIRSHEEELLAALHKDLHKPPFEAYTSEIGTVYQGLQHTLDHLKEWTRSEQVSTPLSLQIASSSVTKEPLGVVLIIAPWNYPFQLVMEPLIAAISAGNCVLVKPSEDAPHTAIVTAKIISKVFDPKHVYLVHGEGKVVVPELVAGFRFDHIFFTGSPAVGRKIMVMAAPQLIPVTLELGGKSPAIVDRYVDLKTAVKRIAWGKYFNAGQTCIAPDHVLIHEDRKDEFLEILQRTLIDFYGDDPQKSSHYGRIINTARFEKLRGYLGQGRTVIGGQVDSVDRYIAPSVVVGVTHDDSVMQEEIFGPILPVITWREKEEVLALVDQNPFPLSTYVFSKNAKSIAFFTERIAFGGGCINNCLFHFANGELPFGGIGTSGMGRYHGKCGFDTFSHWKSIVDSSTLIDHGLQYPPYTKVKEKLARWSMK
ncbi:MAG: aldehyde dehydrogenase [Flavobacteriales bacterium]|nr:aldehyde dehydrogenase [Flavobacteriales bacterium]